MIRIAANRSALALLAMALSASLAARAQAGEPWMLMGREGGCVELAKAAQRKEILAGITAPGEFAARLAALGEPFTREDIARDGTTVVVMGVPERQLSLIFVPRSLCP